MRETRGTNIEVKKNNRNHIFRYLCAQTQTVSNPEIASALSMSSSDRDGEYARIY